MSNNNLLKQFFKYVSFNIVAMIAVSCFIIADTIFISMGIGINGLTALNLAIPVFNFVAGFGLLIGIGGSTIFSIAISRGKIQDSRNIFTISFFLCIISSIILFLLGLFQSENIAKLLGANAEVLADTTTYLKFTLLFAPAFIFNQFFLCFLKNIGRPSVTMLAMIVSSFSNILLDYIFIFQFNWGMFGAVFATGLSPIIGIVIQLPFIIKEKKSLRLVRIVNAPSTIQKILKLGSSSFIIEISSGIVLIAFNYMILKISDNMGVAAYGIIANLFIMNMYIFNGIAQGSQPLFSRYYGLGNLDHARLVRKYALRLSIIISLITYLIYSIFHMQIIYIFHQEMLPELVEIAALGMCLYFLALPFTGYNVICAMFCSSTTRAMSSFIISILRGFILTLPILFILSSSFGLVGVWLTLFVSEALTSIASYFFTKSMPHILVS